MDHTLETGQLFTIQAVTSAGSFSKAAEQLGVTQSAVSQSIKNIEKKLGVTIFHRSGKQVYLTCEGEKLDQLARGFFEQMENTLHDLQNDKDQMQGPVRLGTLMGIGKSWLAPLALDFADNNPLVQIDLQLGFSEQLVKQFEQGKIDILILPDEHLPNSGEKTFLGEETLTLVTPKNKVFPDITEIKSRTLDELSELPVILFERDDQLFFKWCSQHYGKIPANIKWKFIINSHGHILQAVSRGLGMAVLPLHVIRRSIYKDQINYIEDDESSLFSNGKFYLVSHKKSTKLARVEKVKEFLLHRHEEAQRPFRML